MGAEISFLNLKKNSRVKRLKWLKKYSIIFLKYVALKLSTDLTFFLPRYYIVAFCIMIIVEVIITEFYWEPKKKRSRHQTS